MNSVVVLGPDLKKTYTGPQTPDPITFKVYRNVTCYPPEGLIFKRLKPIALDQITEQRIKYRFPWKNLLAVKKYKKKSVLHLTGKNHGSFGHYFLEQFPRLLRFLEVKKTQNLENFDILVSSRNSNHVHQIIKIFDLEVNKIHTLKNIPLKFEELFYVNPPSDAYRIFNQIDSAILNKHLPKVHFNSQLSSLESLFLTRSNAPRRRLLNENKLFHVCRDFFPDLKLIDLGKLNLQKQIEAMRNAKLVIGPTGQAFASSIFCSENSHNIVITNFPGSPFNWSDRFASLATLKGGKGIVLHDRNRNEIPINSFHQDWNYSESLLRQQLQEIFPLLRKS